MKKFTTILACICFAVSTAFAVPVKHNIANHLNYQFTPEGLQKLRKGYAEAKIAHENGADNCYTRSFEEGNRVWNLSVLLSEEKICDMVTVTDDTTGENTKLGFDRIPYYAAYYAVTCRVKGEAELYNYIYYTMCWPSIYVYSQIFTYDGPLQDGQIPLANRNNDPVPMSELANNPDFTNNFKETNYIGSDVITGTTKFENWTLLENSMDSSGGICIFEGKDAQTVVNGTTGSTIVFNSFDKESSEINVQARYILRFYPDGSSLRTVRNNYVGTARVEGFEPSEQTLPEFGDLHLFNAGLGSSELYGDLNPYSGVWGPYTQLYACIGDTHLEWYVDDTAKEFSKNVIQVDRVNVSSDEDVDTYANFLTTYLYADPKYADTSLNPEGIFHMENPLVDMDNQTVTIIPQLNTFVPYGYVDSWSEDYGTFFMVNNETDLPAYGSTLGWGTPEGFKMELKNPYKKTVKAMSAGNVIYHYDPMNVQQTRVYPLTGNLSWEDGVETVAAEAAAISARNGVITVVPAADCNVAVYSLDGACVKTLKGEAGNTVNVAVEKGVYVVVAGETSKKVVL